MRCGGIFNKHFAASLLENLTVIFFLNLLRIKRVTTMSLVSPFLEHSVESNALRQLLAATLILFYVRCADGITRQQ